MTVLPHAAGVTFPRLKALIEAYSRRRLRELREAGAVVALAVNDPQRLGEVLAEAAAPPSEPAHVDPEVQELVRRWVHGN